METKKLKKLEKSFRLQKDSSDCGIACIRSIAAFYNDTSLSVEHLRDISGTNTQGTSLLGLSDAMIKLGFEAQPAMGNIEILKNHKDPIILHVLIDEKYEHYVVCYGFDGDKFTIGDPAHGIQSWAEDELTAKWKNKYCLVVGKKAIADQESTPKKERNTKRKWLLNIIKKDKPLLVFVVALGLIVSGLSLSLSIFFQKLIDNILPNQDTKGLVIGIAFLFVILSFKAVLSTAKSYFSTLFGVHFNKNIIGKFFKILMDLPFSFFNNRKIGDLVARLNDVLVIERVIKYSLSEIVINFTLILASFVVIGYFSMKLFLLCLVFCPIYFYCIYKFSFKISKSQTEVMKNYANNEAAFISTINNMSIVKGFNYQKTEHKKIKNVFGKYQNKIFDLGIIELKLGAIIEALGLVITLVVLALSGYLVITNEIKLGEFMTLMSIAMMLISSIAKFSLSFIPFQEAKIAFERMYDFTLLDKEQSGTIKINKIESITFENVAFKYPGSTNLLSNINLNIEKGNCVGLIGKSGSGKSTIASMLQRFLNVTEGNIKVNDTHNVNDIVIEDWRSLMSVVPQDISFIDGDIMSNICMSEMTKDKAYEVIKFCQEAGLHDFIIKLPQGYNTIVGDGGIQLSGGQKQVIGLARALFQNPDFIIMDEPMSSMDTTLQEFTINLLKKLKKDAAILLITHKLEDLKEVTDDVYVIEDNVVAKQGQTQYLRTS